MLPIAFLYALAQTTGVTISSHLGKKTNIYKKLNETKGNISKFIWGLGSIITLAVILLWIYNLSFSIMGIPIYFVFMLYIYIITKIPNIPILLGLSFFLLLIFILKSIEIEVNGIENKKYLGTVISTKDNTYNTSDSSYYIGKTASYVFIHNKYDSSNIIIPTEEIKLMIIKINKKSK